MSMALFIGAFSACRTHEPADPREAIPGPRSYYNDALNFSLDYPHVLSVKVEDRGSVDSPGIRLRLSYPGNEFQVFELTTENPGMSADLHEGMIADSERTEFIGGETGTRFLLMDPDETPAGDGTLKRVMVERFDRLYVFTGRGESFEQVLESFRFEESGPAAQPDS